MHRNFLTVPMTGHRQEYSKHPHFAHLPQEYMPHIHFSIIISSIVSPNTDTWKLNTVMVHILHAISGGNMTVANKYQQVSPMVNPSMVASTRY